MDASGHARQGRLGAIEANDWCKQSSANFSLVFCPAYRETAEDWPITCPTYPFPRGTPWLLLSPYWTESSIEMEIQRISHY